MKRYTKITPEGTSDLLFDECRSLRRVEDTLSGVFESRGFRRVLTPGLEFYDIFMQNPDYIEQERMYKLSDNKGRLLVLRPDSTLPIARLVSTRLRDETLPIRLYYSQNVYRLNQKMRGKSDEIVQSGIELIGKSGIKADIEVILTAVDSLRALGVQGFKIEIGHIGFFEELAQLLGLAEEQKERARQLMEGKNYGALAQLLEGIKAPEPVKQALKLLPRAFGGAEVFDQEKSLCVSERTCEIFAYLKNMYDRLCKLGLEDVLMIDLGLVHQTNYYTGVIFKGFIPGSGKTVLTGGRYDNMLREFDFDVPATGFAIDVDIIARMLGGADGGKPADILVHSEDGFEQMGAVLIREQIAQGRVCENSLCDTPEEAVDYARRKGIARVLVVGDKLRTIDVVGETA